MPREPLSAGGGGAISPPPRRAGPAGGAVIGGVRRVDLTLTARVGPGGGRPRQCRRDSLLAGSACPAAILGYPALRPIAPGHRGDATTRRDRGHPKRSGPDRAGCAPR